MRNSYFYSSLIDNLRYTIGIIYAKRAFVGPHTVMIDIEDNCDLNCIMCYFHSPLLEKKNEFQRLDYEAYEEILKNLKRIGTRKITICGKGEPFLHPEIEKIIRLTKKLGFYLNIFTNGIYIDKNFFPEIFKLDQINFSIHAGDKDTYYKVHPTAEKGSFENICYILAQIQDYKRKYRKNYPWVKVINVIFNLNYDKIEKMFNFAEEFKVDEILFKPAQLSQAQNSLKMNFEQLNYLFQSFKKYENFKTKNNIPEYLATVAKISTEKMDKKEKKFCFLPWYQSVILTNGDVVACPYNQKILGNIKEKNFSEIWFSEEYNKFRQNLECDNCFGEAVYPYLRKFKKLWSINR